MGDRVGRQVPVSGWACRAAGQGLAESGLLLALVAVLVIAGLVLFGPAITSLRSSLGGLV